MDDVSNLKEAFEQEVYRLQNDSILSQKERKKQLFGWSVRTAIAAILYIIFWKYTWVRWSLIIYVPLNISVLIIFFVNRYRLQKKLDNVQKKFEELEEKWNDHREY